MWIADQQNKVVHDMSRPQYECQISKIPKDVRKKIYTIDGVKRFLDDPLNKGWTGCRFCMPESFEFNLNSIFENN